MNYLMIFRILFVAFLLSIRVLAVFPVETDEPQDSVLAHLIINKISIEGNKVTKKHIILRELEFAEQDTLSTAELSKKMKLSEQNLMNTTLFNFATVASTASGSNSVNITISVTERWYTWPFPFFEIADPNFNTWWLTKDFSRTSYGIYVIRENFRGRKESLKFRLRLGYDEQLAGQYHIPFINRKQTTGIEFTAGYSRNHEINYKTLDDKRVFYSDDKNYVREEFFVRTKLIHRKKLYNTHQLILQYDYASVADTVSEITANDAIGYFKNKKTNTQYLTLTWHFKRDKRDYASYPLTGYMFAAELTKEGLGIANSQGLNLLKSFLTFHTHFKIEDRLYFGSAIKTKFNLLDNPPYYLQKGLGYDNFVRGYEFYVVDGQSYGLLRTNIKYQLIKPVTGELNFIKTEKFSKFHFAAYFNLFADAGYVVDGLYTTDNALSNELLWGAGIGLDFLTYYDFVVRMEFSVNKFGEDGFFLHFVKPI